MNRIVCFLAVCALAFVLAVPAAARDGAPAGFAVVEAFFAAINDGDVPGAIGLLDPDAIGLEIAGEEVTLETTWQFRTWMNDLIAAGAHIDTEFLAIHGDGSVIVTLEHTRADTIPSHLEPLQSTGMYVVREGRLAALTRVMHSAQRDALLSTLFVGQWRCHWYAWDVSSDGAYELAFLSDGTIADSGSFDVVDGVAHMISDEGSSVCSAGDVATWTLAFSGHDVLLLRILADECEPRAPLTGRYSIGRVVGH